VNELVRRLGLPHQHPARRITNIGAIQVRADAAPQLLQMLGFAEASVRARGAGCATRGECVQRFHVVVGMLAVSAWVAAEHHVDSFHMKLGLRRTVTNLFGTNQVRHGAEISTPHRENRGPAVLDFIDHPWTAPQRRTALGNRT
jgi:hypothetical protein